MKRKFLGYSGIGCTSPKIMTVVRLLVTLTVILFTVYCHLALVQANPIVPPIGRFVLRVESIHCDPKEVSIGGTVVITFIVKAEDGGWIEGYYVYAIVPTTASSRIVASDTLLESRWVHRGQRFHGSLSVRVPEDARSGPLVVMFWQKPSSIVPLEMAELPTNVELWLLGFVKGPEIKPPTTVTVTRTVTVNKPPPAFPPSPQPINWLAIAIVALGVCVVIAVFLLRRTSGSQWRRG